MQELLIVDDEKLVCEGLKKAINWTALGFCNVHTALNGEEAMEIIKKKAPALVLSDISMPVMDGIQLARYISKFYSKTKVIFISAYNDFTYARQAIDFGVRSYLLKPIDREELKETVIRVMKMELPGVKSIDTDDENTQLINKVHQYIMDNCEHKISLDDIAGYLYISPQYFCKKFKKITGKQFVDYVLEVKISKAKALLTDSSIRVKDISVKLGFSDYTYFCKVFKKYAGFTPLKFRADNIS